MRVDLGGVGDVRLDGRRPFGADDRVLDDEPARVEARDAANDVRSAARRVPATLALADPDDADLQLVDRRPAPIAAAPEPWTDRSNARPSTLSIARLPEPLSQAAVRSCVPMLISTGPVVLARIAAPRRAVAADDQRPALDLDRDAGRAPPALPLALGERRDAGRERDLVRPVDADPVEAADSEIAGRGVGRHAAATMATRAKVRGRDDAHAAHLHRIMVNIRLTRVRSSGRRPTRPC